MSLYAMLDEIKEALRPEQHILTVRDELLFTLNKKLEGHEFQALAVPGGSMAKGTFLHADHDLDIFIRYSLEYGDEELPEMTEELLKEFKPKRLHGSRDYFQFTYKDIDVEVIPVIAVEGVHHARNVTDMSPLHVEYFLANGHGLQDEVRLAKQFCKSAGVYGAESYIRGFSGHVIDLLILQYKSFYELIKQAATWKAPVIIDLENHHRDALAALDRAKHSPLIIVDPMQPERNAAAALDQENFEAFVVRSKEFIKNPSQEFFIISSMNKDEVKKSLEEHSGSTVIVNVTHDPEEKKDIAGAKVRKVFERISADLIRTGFTVADEGWQFSPKGNSFLWFVTQEHSLTRLEKRMGPPIHEEEAAQKFRSMHQNTTQESGRLYAQVPRAFRTPHELIASLIPELEKSSQLHVSIDSN